MHLETSILIDRTPEEVWAYLGDISNVPRGIVFASSAQLPIEWRFEHRPAAIAINTNATAYTSNVKKAFKKISALLFFAAVIALLLLVLTSHGVDQHGFELFFFALIPVFLFGFIAQTEIVSFWFSTSYLPIKPVFLRVFLLQLPPPSENY